MSKDTFFHSTPADIDIFIEEHDKRIEAEQKIQFERMKYAAWLNGLYVQNAVASVMSKKAKYPKKPYGEKDDETIVCTEDMSAEQKEAVINLLFGNLEEMQHDFERQNKIEKGGE